MRWFEDDALVAKFLALPETIARRHRNKAAFNVSAAVEMQIALAIELLTVAPVRCDNLHAIHLERNLVRVGSHKDPQAHLYFPPDTVKNEVELEFPLPSSTVGLLNLYLAKFRPKLVRATNDWLFPGKAQGPKQAALLSNANCQDRGTGDRGTPHRSSVPASGRVPLSQTQSGRS